MRTFALLIVATLALSGCLSHAPLAKKTFLFDTPNVTNAAASADAPALEIRKVSVAPQFDNLSFTYRNGDLSYEQDPYAAFLAPPAESLETPMSAGLRNAGIFSAVTGPDSALQPKFQLDASVLQLYGDFQKPSRPTAVLAMRFALFERTTRGTRLVFQKNYAQEIPVKIRTAAAVMAGWNEALQRDLAQLAGDLKSNLK